MPPRSTRNAPAAAPLKQQPTRSSRRLRSSADVVQSPLRALSPPRRATRGKKRAAPASDDSAENRPPKRVDTRSRGTQSTSEDLTTEKSSGEKSSSTKSKPKAKPKAAALTTKKPRKTPAQNKYATRDAITRSLRSNTQKQKEDDQATRKQIEDEEVHRLYNISFTPFNSALNKPIDIYVDPPQEETTPTQPKLAQPQPSPPKVAPSTPSQTTQPQTTPSSSRWSFVFGPVSKLFGLSRTTASAPTTPKNTSQITSPVKALNPRTEPRPVASRNPSNMTKEQRDEVSAASPSRGNEDRAQSSFELPSEQLPQPSSKPASESPIASPSDAPSSPFGDVAKNSPPMSSYNIEDDSDVGDDSPTLGRQTAALTTPRIFKGIKSPLSHQQPGRTQPTNVDDAQLNPPQTAPPPRRFLSRTPRHLKSHSQRMRERREADAKKVAEAERKKLEIVAEEDLRLKAEARQIVQKAREEAEKKQAVGEKRKKVRIDDLELIPSGPPGTFSLIDKYFEQGSSSEDELDEDEVARDTKDEDTTQPRAAKRVRFSDASTSRLNIFQAKPSPSPYALMHAPYPSTDEAVPRPDPYAYAQKHHVWIGEKSSAPERPADFNWEGHFAVPDDSDTESDASVIDVERDSDQRVASASSQSDKPTTPGPNRALPPGKGLKYKALSDGSLVLMEYDLEDNGFGNDKTPRNDAQAKAADTPTPPETPKTPTSNNIFAQAQAKTQAEQAAASAQADPKTPDASKPKADTAAALQKAAAAANKHQPKTPSKLREVSRYSSPITSEDASGMKKGATATAGPSSSPTRSPWPANVDPSLRSEKAAILAASVTVADADSDWPVLVPPVEITEAMRQYIEQSAEYKKILEKETNLFHELALSLGAVASASAA